MAKTTNVVLITIDSLRASHLSCLGYPIKTTPNLDNLAKDGILFNNSISCGPDTPTSITPLLSSSYILMHLVKNEGLDKLRIATDEGFEKLSSRNYSTFINLHLRTVCTLRKGLRLTIMGITSF